MLEIFPSIDLKDGMAVRLSNGLLHTANIYGDPVRFANVFNDYGARWLHIVDLDGAFNGSPCNFEVIKDIASSTSLKLQVGGGIRSEDTIKRYIDLGVDRIVLSSVAVADPDFALMMSGRYSVAIGIDCRDGVVATHGWVCGSDFDPLSFAGIFRGSNVEAIICTDISRDGRLSGLNAELARSIATTSGLFTIASGGFSGISDLELIKNYKEVQGVIVGRAFYEGSIDFAKTGFVI